MGVGVCGVPALQKSGRRGPYFATSRGRSRFEAITIACADATDHTTLGVQKFWVMEHAMATKEKKTEGELVAIIMNEVRQHPDCGDIERVVITRPVQRTRDNPNWEPAWVVTGKKIAPLGAFEVGRRLQAQFDVAQIGAMALSADARLSSDQPVGSSTGKAVIYNIPLYLC
jgi:hypothetical protein